MKIGQLVQKLYSILVFGLLSFLKKGNLAKPVYNSI
jgi:hypothetical protein